MVPRRPSHPLRSCRTSLSSIRTLAPLATLLLAPATAQAAQGTCGIAAGMFQVDGQFYSSAQYTDWAQGSLGTAVFADDGTSLITPSLRARDGHWGGHETDLDAFAGTGNKNNDDISAQGDPWTWGKGSGPSKNDLTDVVASSAMVDGQVWLFLGANTRTNTGSSHVDFEISQAGFVRSGTQSGTIVGLGPHAGRTADVDFIVSVDYENGGGVPTVSLRTWRASSGGYQFVQSIPNSGDVFICTNDQAVPAGPWGTIAPDGSVSTEVAPFQFVEIAVNLTNLGIDPSVYCSSPSTLMFKTRSSPSFTSTLKDLTMHPFSLVSPPPATITPGRAIYCVGDVATLCAPAQPSAGRYRYEWDGPGAPYADAACIETGLAGTYQLVVHDLWSGCSAETSFELVLTELPIADITFDTDVICAGETAEFCGPEPRSGSAYAYAWSGPGGVRSDARCLQVSEAGAYNLTVTDLVTGCVSVPAEHTLTVNALPVATIAGTGAICAGTSTELCGPDGDYDYAWEGPGGALPNQRCITVSAAGTYQLTLRDRATGCVGLAAAHDLVVMPLPVAEITGPASFCPGAQADLCGPEGDLAYTWSGPNGALPSTRCITVDAAGTYRLTVENRNGCVSSTEHELFLNDLPTADITFDTDVICAGGTAEFCGPEPRSGSAYAYAWSGPGGVRSDARCLQVSVAGVYGLTVTDLVTGCVSVPAEHSLTVNTPPVATIAGTGAICAGTSTELCGPDGDYDYAWEGPGDALPNQRCITVSAAGTYQLTLRDRATGCVGLAATHDLEVMPLPVAEITGPASFCPGTRADLCGPEGDLAYAWSGPNGALPSTRCITVDAAGTYTLTVENRAGCVSSITEHELTLEEGVVVTEMEDLFRCTGDRGEFCVEATGSGPFTYVWSKDGDVIAGATEPCFAIPSISAASAGEYAVEVSGRCDSVVRRATLTLADVQVAGLRDAYLCEGQPFELCPEVSGLGPFTYFWRNETRGFVASDQSCFTIDSVDADDEGIYTLTVTGQCGDPVVVEFRVRVGRCEQFCSKSQGFWGNDGGAWMGQRVPQLLDAIITATDPIVLGAPSVRSVTIGEGAERCVIEFLPASGPAEPLPSGLGDAVVDGATCGASLGLTLDGRLSNGLLAAALVTELNSRIDPRLLNMRVCAEMITVPALPGPDGQIGTADDVPDALNPKFYSMPAGVLESLATLQFRDSVRGLLNLANLALAGMTGYLPVSLGEIEAALQTIVTLTHDCALVIECEYPSGGPRNPTGETPLFSTQGTTPVSSGQTQLGGNATNIAVPAVAYLRNPNPVRGAATIAFGMPEAAWTRIMVYDVSGRVVASLVDSTVPAGHHTVPLGGRQAGMSTGVYFVRMEARGVQSGERFQHTSKLVVVR